MKTKTEKTLKEIIKEFGYEKPSEAQYVYQSDVIALIKTWLEQKKRLIEQDTKDSFPDDSDLPHNIGRVMELEDLIGELTV